MKPYADDPHRMAWQIVADCVAVAAIIVSVRVGMAVHDTIARLASVGERVEGAGNDLSGSLSTIGDTLAGIPLVGSLISDPFTRASDAAHGITDMGVAIQEQVHAVATLAGVIVAVAPIIVVLLVWLVPRLRFAVRAARVARIAATPAGRDLLALRALVSAPLKDLERLSTDVAADWRTGNHAIVEALAALEMDRSGVRPRLEAPRGRKELPPRR